MEQLICFSITDISTSDFTVLKITKNMSEQQMLMINHAISKLMNINNDLFIDFLCSLRKDNKESNKNYYNSEIDEKTCIQYENESSNWLKDIKILDLLKMNNYYFTVYHQLDSITSILLFLNSYIINSK